MEKRFVQSKRRFIIYSIFVLLCSGMALLTLGTISFGGIGALGMKGALAVVAVAVGITIFYMVAMLCFRGADVLIVTDDDFGKICKGKRTYFLNTLYRAERSAGIIHKLLRTEKISLSFSNGVTVCLVFSEEASQEFIDILPQQSVLSEDLYQIRSGREKYFIILSDLLHLVLLAVIIAVTAFPVLFAYLVDFDKFLPFLIGYGIVFLIAVLVMVIFRVGMFLHYAGFVAHVREGGLSILYGKKAGGVSDIRKSDIAGLELGQGILEKFAGLYRVKLVLIDSVNGGTERTVFPFLLKREEAGLIARCLYPGIDLGEKVSGGGVKAFVPYLQYLAIPAIIVFCLSFYINFYLLLFELDFALFGLLLYLRKGYRAHEAFAELRCGVFLERRAILSYENMKCVIGKKNPIACSQKVTALEISFGKYSPAFFCGYISDAEFSKLVEKVNK